MPSSIEMEAVPLGATYPSAPSAWSVSTSKRIFDCVLSSVGLLFALPIMGVIGVLVKCSSPGPIFFRQRRAGRFGAFELLKFRTMRVASGPLLTRQGDKRVTPIGRILRRTKLDELPQLFNVLRGDMSLVGPRPDLPQFWETLTGTCPQIFELRPGLTGEASLHFRNEERLLGSIPDERLTDYYLSTVLPQKARIDLEYAKTATLLSDLKLLFATFFELFNRTK